MTDQLSADIVVVGAGTSGCSFACYTVSFRRLLAVSPTAGNIEEHYQHFPDDPAELEAWVAAARPMWGET